jgi:AcrR family transcriptional regulator
VTAASEAHEPHALAGELAPAEEALVRAAYRLIASKGIERTTLQDITDAAGVSKALAVYYFKTKENLLLAAIRWVLGRVAERMTGVVESVDAPEAKVQAMVDAIFVDPRRNRDFYLAYTALIGEAARNERFNELNVTFRSIMNTAYEDLIRSGEGTVFVVNGVEEAAMGVRALIDGFFLQWLEESDWAELHSRYKQLCTAAILRYLGAA